MTGTQRESILAQALRLALARGGPEALALRGVFDQHARDVAIALTEGKRPLESYSPRVLAEWVRKRGISYFPEEIEAIERQLLL